MDTSQIFIRPFEEKDLDDIQKIREQAFAPVFQSFRSILGIDVAVHALASVETEQAELLLNLCDPKSSEDVFVALVNNVIVGFVSISLDHEQKVGEIGLNAVHPDYAGQGLGTKLYDFALGKMKQAGMLVAAVGTGGDASHEPARRAYEKVGFGPSLPSLWMYKKL